MRAVIMNKLRKDAFYLIGISVTVSILLAWYLSISCSYPYYFIWDMDFTAALDTVQIHSVLLPSHATHPGFGMYLFLFFTEKIAHHLGAVSILSFKDLMGSLNPLAAMAELTDFIRLHSPFLALSAVILLSAALYLLSAGSRCCFLLALVILGTQESVTYHSSMIRTELYSVFYWSCAFFTMVTAVMTARRLAGRCLFFLTGLFMGLSFLSKAQSFPYLLVLLASLFLTSSLFPGGQNKEVDRKNKKLLPWTLIMSAANLFFFLFLCIASRSHTVPEGIKGSELAFSVTPLAVTIVLFFSVLFLYELFRYLPGRASRGPFRLAPLLSVISSGFMMTFALYFLLYPNLTVSLHYLLVNFKILFFGKFTPLCIEGASYYTGNFLAYYRYDPAPVTVFIFLNLLLFLGHRFWFVRLTKKQLGLCLFISVIAIVDIIAGTRPVLRDILWREILLNLINLYYFAIFLVRAVKYRRILLTICYVLFAILFFVNCGRTCIMTKRIDAEYNRYGWLQYKWLENVFPYNTSYTEFMKTRYAGPAKNPAMAAAIDHNRIRRTVDFIFKNQAITQRNIGIVCEDFPVWVSDPGWKISRIPPDLRNAILVDNSSLDTRTGTYFIKDAAYMFYMDKIKEPPPGKKIAVLARSDLEILLFVYGEDIPKIMCDGITNSPYSMTLQKDGQTAVLNGLKITDYCEVPLDKIGKRYFFVVRQL